MKNLKFIIVGIVAFWMGVFSIEEITSGQEYKELDPEVVIRNGYCVDEWQGMVIQSSYDDQKIIITKKEFGITHFKMDFRELRLNGWFAQGGILELSYRSAAGDSAMSWALMEVNGDRQDLLFATEESPDKCGHQPTKHPFYDELVKPLQKK
ncbi:hypothetical protein HN858_03350 [Candidatus Falkowbacteria bacterium]|jgi:hypothetical protein|nr:hypothetical protein [Candidatus Falkowbacteria bacterium]MBT5502678.1 hypothetical protein [Candidatus Falkowbacteria bacterium]MBT6574168.1 hypothetical protein [Candidatus Falkowbacteria bacterium]MBT7348685.1 hypothetical protein [Candidatus Falkowbacteria bacterium]MBT7500475.1 hypothetical protein [Candidatus Falkowbacteria bacterium]